MVYGWCGSLQYSLWHIRSHLGFRGELEAQGRGSLHPHILVWLLGNQVYFLLRLLKKDPTKFYERIRRFMRATVASMEANCQSSVHRLPRRFGDTTGTVTPLAFNKGEQNLSAYDGGCELDKLTEVEEKNAIQQDFLESAERETWTRPKLPLRDSTGTEINDEVAAPRPSVYSKPLSAFAVSKYPKYREIGVLRQEPQEGDTMSSTIWQQLFSTDVRELVQEVLTHICGESCFKYSGKKVERICRHGFYYIMELVPIKLSLIHI